MGKQFKSFLNNDISAIRGIVIPFGRQIGLAYVHIPEVPLIQTRFQNPPVSEPGVMITMPGATAAGGGCRAALCFESIVGRGIGPKPTEG
jgi:hypothetical protein